MQATMPDEVRERLLRDQRAAERRQRISYTARDLEPRALLSIQKATLRFIADCPDVAAALANMDVDSQDAANVRIAARCALGGQYAAEDSGA